MKWFRSILPVAFPALLILAGLLSSGCKVAEPDDGVVAPCDTVSGWCLLGLAEEEVYAIAVDPGDDDIIYAGSDSDLFKTVNGGITWDTLAVHAWTLDIDIHPINHSVLYVLAGGVRKSTDGGLTWSRADSGMHAGLYGILSVLEIDPVHPETLYVGYTEPYGGGFNRSMNGGQSWEQLEGGMLSSGITAIALNPENTQILYTGTGGVGAINKSMDGGESWVRLDFPEVGIVNDLLVHPNHPGTIYTGTWLYGFYTSTDGGISWEEANTGLPDVAFVKKIALSSSGDLYIAVYDGENGSVYAASEDTFQWTALDDLMDQGIIHALTVTSSGMILAGGKGIYRLSD